SRFVQSAICRWRLSNDSTRHSFLVVWVELSSWAQGLFVQKMDGLVRPPLAGSFWTRVFGRDSAVIFFLRREEESVWRRGVARGGLSWVVATVGRKKKHLRS